jgi:hypothetical protein
MHHNAALDTRDTLESSEKKDKKTIESLKKLLAGLNQAKVDRPDSYWKIGTGVPGYVSAKKWIASLFAVKPSGSGRKVTDVDADLHAKSITREQFDEKIEAITTRIEKLQSGLDDPARIAARREINDDVETAADLLAEANRSAAELVNRTSETREDEELSGDSDDDFF